MSTRLVKEEFSYKDGRRIDQRTGTLRSWAGVNQQFPGTPEHSAFTEVGYVVGRGTTSETTDYEFKIDIPVIG